jgi:hypothetical protein
MQGHIVRYPAEAEVGQPRRPCAQATQNNLFGRYLGSHPRSQVGGHASAVALTTGIIWRRSPESRLLAGMRRAGPRWQQATAAHRLGGDHDHANDGRGGPRWDRCPAWWTGVYRVLLAWISHLPPSAVPLIRDIRF